MKGSSALLAMAPAAAMAAGTLAPSTSAPAGCSTSFSGTFGIRTPNVADSSSPQKRDTSLPTCSGPAIKLNNGVLTDPLKRLGSIVANNQFQFDPAPGQAGVIYTSGWSICDDHKLALGDSKIFWACLSGSFYNLYNTKIAPQCHEVYFETETCVPSTSSSVSAGDGQLTASNDGQYTVPTGTAPIGTAATGYGSGSSPSVIPPYPVNNNYSSPATATGASPHFGPGGSSPNYPVTLPNGSTCPACTACAPTVTITSTVTAGATPAGSSSTPTGESSGSSPNSPVQGSAGAAAPSGAAGATGTSAPSSGTFSGAGTPSSSPITPFKGAGSREKASWSMIVGGLVGGAAVMML